MPLALILFFLFRSSYDCLRVCPCVRVCVCTTRGISGVERTENEEINKFTSHNIEIIYIISRLAPACVVRIMLVFIICFVC